MLQDDRLETLAYAPISRQVVALERCLRSSPVVCRLLDILPAPQLPSWYIGAGAVAQTVWNHLHGFPPSHGLGDYDVVYFDPDDLIADGEQAVEANVAELLDSAVTVDVKNEARAHIWYQRRFGQPLMPYRSTSTRSLPGPVPQPVWAFGPPATPWMSTLPTGSVTCSGCSCGLTQCSSPARSIRRRLSAGATSGRC